MSRVGQFGQISEINDHLLLSGCGVLNPETLHRKGITCIINATADEPQVRVNDVDYVKIHIDDNPGAHLDSHFDFVADKIKSTKDAGGRTLVHCVAGVSRSASLCMVYLVKYERMSLRQAYFHVKGARTIIRPNSGFWRQMIEFERKERGEASVSLVMARKPGELMPDIYTGELLRKQKILAPSISAFRSSSIGPTSRSPRAAMTSSWKKCSPGPSPRYQDRRNGNTTRSCAGPSLSALGMVIPPKTKVTANLFSTLYDSHHKILFPQL